MALEVKLEAFEGPLDLLLYLIEKNRLDIYDIPITEITRQYLEYIRQIERSDMNVMSEFLVMAATLLDIKCRMLLPGTADEQEEETDPREELVQKLLEYKMYKYMSLELKDRQLDAQKAFYKERTMPSEVEAFRPPLDYEALLGEITLPTLHSIFESVLRRQEEKVDPVRSQFGKIEKDEVDMEAKARYLESFLQCHSRFCFRDMLEKQHSRMEVIVTFLVLLELIKTGKAFVEQESAEDEIMVISNETGKK